MKITSKGRYAVMAMVDVARNSNRSPCNLTHVSIRQNISLPYLGGPIWVKRIPRTWC